MWFWYFMLFCDLLVPAIMIICGRIMWKHPPQTPNKFIGYRTPRSMASTESWDFAHRFCGKLWWRIGWIILIPSIGIHLPFYRASEEFLGNLGAALCVAQCAALIVPVFFTERALKRTFGDKKT